MSSDAKLAHGLNPSFAIYDELAQAPDRRLYDALATAMGARAEPLMMVISTQAELDHHVMSELVDYTGKVAAGDVVDPTFASAVYTVPPEADIWQEASWYLANPALGDFRSLDEMRGYAARAKRLPSLEASFRSLYLNQSTSAEAGLLNQTDWRACNGTVDLAQLQGAVAWAGLDLSATRDLTALVLWFPATGAVAAYFWQPAEGLDEREIRDQVPYRLWKQQGYIRTTPGRTVDKRHVVHKVAEILQQFDVQRLAFDRWGMAEFDRLVEEDGVELPTRVEFGQGYKDQTDAVARLEVEVLEHRLRHAGNPVLAWNAANAVAARDPAGNRKIVKQSDERRVDGIIALAMALGTAAREPPVVKLDFSRSLVLSA